MFEPKILVTKMLGCYLIEIVDCEDKNRIWNPPHFTIQISEIADAVIFENCHTNEKIEFFGVHTPSNRFRFCEKRSYDVYRYLNKRSKREKIGNVETGDGLKIEDFLTKPMKTAYRYLKEKYGRDVITLT